MKVEILYRPSGSRGGSVADLKPGQIAINSSTEAGFWLRVNGGVVYLSQMSKNFQTFYSEQDLRTYTYSEVLPAGTELKFVTEV